MIPNTDQDEAGTMEIIKAAEAATPELIVLLDDDGAAIGTAPKATSHHSNTPYHLAFSCYLVDAGGQVLITRRALGKTTFPGVWTNSCCGHPAPGEGLRAAVRRRLRTELGVEAGEITLVLPEFDYRATAEDGTVEHERCPVVRALLPGVASGAGTGGGGGGTGTGTGTGAEGSPLRPDRSEVEDAEWRRWDECVALTEHPEASPWFRLQMARLAGLGAPLDWPAADTALLPEALTW